MKLLIKDTDALLYQNGTFTVKRTNVAVDGTMIVRVGDIPDGFHPDKILGGGKRLLIPGLINTHTHSYMTIFRNYADDLQFNEWLFDRIMPKEDIMQPADGRAATLLAACEMMKTGTTTFCDMHMFENTVCEAVVRTGMRAVVSRGLSGGDDEGGHRRLNEAVREMERFSGTDRLTFMIAPHSVYTCDDKLLRICVEEAAARGIGINIHLSETAGEVADCRAQHGLSPVFYLDSIGMLSVPVLAAHCVHVDDADIALLAERGVSVAHNPVSNLKLANGIAPVTKMMAAGVNVALGTDGCASNNSLNMIREMNVAALIHKGVSGDPQAVTAVDAIKMATVNAAAALGINAGEIAAGRLADLVLLDTDRPEFCPHNDIKSSLCYSANGSEVETVIVNGEITVSGGKLVTVDEEEIYNEVNAVSRRLGLDR